MRVGQDDLEFAVPAAPVRRPTLPPPAAPAAVDAPARRAGARSSARRAGWRVLLHPRSVLLGVLVVQAVLSLRLIWTNTAFQDEALYLWAGHVELAHFVYGTKIPNFATYFSGAPVIYPIIGAIADTYGGLALARGLSLVFMLGATILLYGTTARLFGRRAAIAAAAMFAVLGPVQVLGAFATYDAMALFLLALASWLVVRARGRLGELLLILAGLALALADATKYATGLWDPVVIALAMLTATRSGWVRSVLRGVRTAIYVAIPLVVALFEFGGESYIRGLLFTTISRKAGGTVVTASTVFLDSFNWVGIVFVIALIGVGISFTQSVRIRLLCGTLTAAILLAPAEQARIHILTSLHKHVAFGAWFAAIVAGYALGKGSEVNPIKGWRVIAAATGVTVFLAVPIANSMFSVWSNSAQMVADLRPILQKTNCPCLIAENNVVNYYLPRETFSDKFIGTFSFFYWNGAKQKVEQGMAAYTAAIRNHYFKVIEIDPDENTAIYGPVTHTLADTNGWVLAAKAKSNQPRRPFEIWKYEPGAAPAKLRGKTVGGDRP
jgi:Dolichyl-phosphate-mannose-protein mannosyltransferase